VHKCSLTCSLWSVGSLVFDAVYIVSDHRCHSVVCFAPFQLVSQPGNWNTSRESVEEWRKTRQLLDPTEFRRQQPILPLSQVKTSQSYQLSASDSFYWMIMALNQILLLTYSLIVSVRVRCVKYAYHAYVPFKLLENCPRWRIGSDRPCYCVPRPYALDIDLWPWRRAFSVAAPRVWNRLPTELKLMRSSTTTFKRHLKTFLFNSAHSSHWLMRHQTNCRRRTTNAAVTVTVT